MDLLDNEAYPVASKMIQMTNFFIIGFLISSLLPSSLIWTDCDQWWVTDLRELKIFINPCCTRFNM